MQGNFLRKTFAVTLSSLWQVIGLPLWHQDLRFLVRRSRYTNMTINPFISARDAINRYICLDLQDFFVSFDMRLLFCDVSKPMLSSFMCECKTTLGNIFPLRKP